MTIRIHVLTTDLPTFLVSTVARDEFISEMVAELYGMRADGSEHEWEAEVLNENEAHQIIVA